MKKVLTLTATTAVPTDFTEFANLSEINHRCITFQMMKTIDELKKEIKALQDASRHQGMGKEPTASDTPEKVYNVDKAHRVSSTKEEATPVDAKEKRESSTFGMKIGKSSDYHFVNAQKTNGRFDTYRASTSIGGKTIAMGGSKDEIQCALLADAYLDKIGDEKRPRNRDDFPEVMEMYQKSQKKEKNA